MYIYIYVYIYIHIHILVRIVCTSNNRIVMCCPNMGDSPQSRREDEVATAEGRLFFFHQVTCCCWGSMDAPNQTCWTFLLVNWTVLDYIHFFCDYWLWLIIILNIVCGILAYPFLPPTFLAELFLRRQYQRGVRSARPGSVQKVRQQSQWHQPAELNPILGVWKEVSTGGRRLEMSSPDFVKALGWPLERYHFSSKWSYMWAVAPNS